MLNRPAALFLCIALSYCSASRSSARTWYVAQDGSGDAQTILAAIDSTVSGDVILVGPGNYAIGAIETGGLVLKSGTTIVSELGPASTVLFPADGSLQSSVLGLVDGCAVRGLTLIGGQDTAVFCSGLNIEVSGNIIHGRLRTLGPAVIHHNLVDLPGSQSKAVRIGQGASVQLYNNIVLGEVAFDEPSCASQTTAHCNLIQAGIPCFGAGADANFSGDPFFCGVANYYLRSDSPCAPGNMHDNVSCGQIGPLPVGCGTVAIKAKTWGAMKAMYKD